MPNWCDNTLTITHPNKSKLDAIETALSDKTNQALFNTILPNPSGEWDYEWSVNNWGTKWEASVHDWERQDDNTIWVSFDSAWSPPTQLYEFMEAVEGYTVVAMYWESGMGFCGRFADGYDDYYDYDITDIDSINSLPEELLDFTDLLNRHEDWVADTEAEEEYQEYLMTVTDWYPAEVNPVRPGNYEVKAAEAPSWPFYKKVFWDGTGWSLDGKEYKIAGWRGLREDPNDN
jgi:hypothetical protein